MYLISIIVPVYNAENYLDNTINSVINQSIGFENLELILVNDNSTDNSKKIIDQYCNNYDNIVAYHSDVNHGFPGFGRNMGVKLAKSEYIMFLDNDDEYDNEICKKLYDTLINEKADFVSCGRVIIDELGESKDSYYFSGGRNSNDYIIFENDEIFSLRSITIWNKIFKKEIILNSNLKFLENSSADDFAFSVEYNLKSNKIVHLNNYFGYKWNVRNESLSNDIKIEHIKEVIVAYYYIVDIIKDNDKLTVAFELLKHMISLLILKSSYLNANFNDFKEILNDINEFYSSLGVNIVLDDKLLNWGHKLVSHNYYRLAILYLRILKHVRKINFLRKINRVK